MTILGFHRVHRELLVATHFHHGRTVLRELLLEFRRCLRGRLLRSLNGGGGEKSSRDAKHLARYGSKWQEMVGVEKGETQSLLLMALLHGIHTKQFAVVGESEPE